MKFREMVKAMQLESGFSDKESQEALEQMVESVAERLGPGERKDFASQLPAELQEIAFGAETLDKKSKRDLLKQFMDKQKIQRDRAKKQILSAWAVLKAAITPGEIDDIRAQLPNDTAAFLH